MMNDDIVKTLDTLPGSISDHESEDISQIISNNESENLDSNIDGSTNDTNAEPEENDNEEADVQQDDELIVEDKNSKDNNLDTQLDTETEAQAAVVSNLLWYVVQTHSGFESRAKLNLEERIKQKGLTRYFGRILVPQETVEEVNKSGNKRMATKKVFPGYILVQMELDEESWHLVKSTPKVSGFIGNTRNPSPLGDHEVKDILDQVDGNVPTKRFKKKNTLEQGDSIKVIDGPFAEFNGTVDEIKSDKGKLRVLLSIFGRSTPVELDFTQVEKV